MKAFKRIIYLILTFAFFKAFFGARLGAAYALNEAIPIIVIAMFLTMLYWFFKLFVKSSAPELEGVETQALGNERLTDEPVEVAIPYAKEKTSQNIRPDELSVGQEVVTNVELAEKLKGKPRCDFTSSFQVCEICETTKTGQTLNGHYVCGSCKQRYI